MAGGTNTGQTPGELDDGPEDLNEIDETEGDLEGEDDAGDDGEGQVDAGGDDEEAGAQGNVARRGGARDTIRGLRARAQEAERQRDTEREEFQRRLTEVETRTRQPQGISPAEQARLDAEEAARVELMTPAEVARFYAEKSERRIAQHLGNVQFQTADQIDRQSFESMAAANPLLARVAPKVDELLERERRQGRNSTRIIVAKYLLGDELFTRHQANLGRQRNGANRRVARQTTTRVNGAGDAQRPNGRQGDESIEATRRRVANVPL